MIDEENEYPVEVKKEVKRGKLRGQPPG